MTATVDPRFSELIDDILSREWLLLVQPNQTILAGLLGVTRQSVWCWENHKANISKDLAMQFQGRIGLLGYFSEQVLSIHADLQEQRLAEKERQRLPRVDVPIVHVNLMGKLSNRRRTTPNDQKLPKRMPRHWK